jgi:hypothetical protein
VNFEFLGASIVVVAKKHNPTILHPSFLVAQKITPDTWKTSEVICTPPFAMVKYENGIVLTVEESKFQVIDTQINKHKTESPISNIAAEYTKILPHVHYESVGTNFQAIVLCEKSEERLAQHFLISRSAMIQDMQPKSVGLRLVYDVMGSRFRISLDAGEAKAGSEEKKVGIIIDANYHVELQTITDKSAIEGISKVASKFCEYMRHFEKTVEGLLAFTEK